MALEFFLLLIRADSFIIKLPFICVHLRSSVDAFQGGLQ